MKLNPNFITQEIDDTLFLVPVGNEEFKGIVRNNKTASFIINQLKEKTTRESIIAAMSDKYDAPEEVLVKDVDTALSKLREIGALDE